MFDLLHSDVLGETTVENVNIIVNASLYKRLHELISNVLDQYQKLPTTKPANKVNICG